MKRYEENRCLLGSFLNSSSSMLQRAALATFLVIAWASDVSQVQECDGDQTPCALSMVQMKINGLAQGRESEASDGAACLLLDSEIHQAVSPLLPDFVKTELVEAWSQLATDYGCHTKLKNISMSKVSFLQQKASLVNLLRSLTHVTLKPAREPVSANGITTFTYQSVDTSTSTIGTGRLGQFSANESVSHVTIQANQTGPFLWDLSASEMKFTIGPSIRGTFLISGSLWPLQATPEGIRGQIRAGFVNLRSTATGEWSTGSEGLTGNLSLSFGGFLNKTWTWKAS